LYGTLMLTVGEVFVGIDYKELRRPVERRTSRV
jgi:hypothetical protein